MPSHEFTIVHYGVLYVVVLYPCGERSRVVSVLKLQDPLQLVAIGGWLNGKLVRTDLQPGPDEGHESVSREWPFGLARVVEKACKEVVGHAC